MCHDPYSLLLQRDGSSWINIFKIVFMLLYSIPLGFFKVRFKHSIKLSTFNSRYNKRAILSPTTKWKIIQVIYGQLITFVQRSP